MNKRIIMLMVAALALLSASGEVEFTGVGEYPVIKVTPDKNTGLDMIYVVYDTQGVGMSYKSDTGKRPIWESFGTRGAAYSEEVHDVQWDGITSKLQQVQPNTGYVITEELGAKPFYCWVVNYADYMMSLNDIFFESEKSCTLLKLRVDGIVPPIPYYTIVGNLMVLDREIELIYSTLEWDGGNKVWQDKTVTEKVDILDNTIQVEQPLCNTVFQLWVDRFLKEWNVTDMEKFIESRYYETHAVACEATAVNDREESDSGETGEENEEEGEDEGGLGGSAPVHIVFTGYPTDAVVYRVWEIATDPEFENVIRQFNQDELDYVFDETGDYYVRYIVANADGTCELIKTFEVSVSESYLPENYEIPNVFSPGCTEGINDIWKVWSSETSSNKKPKSLIEFHCWIFNRWGTMVYEFTDPEGGWDGKYRGSYVDTGVYFYVITATGSDGIKYKRRGDINVLRYSRGEGTPSGGGGSNTGGGTEDIE